MAKADSNYEKNRQQISFDFPLKNDTEKSHDSTQLCGTLEKLEYLVENETKNENIFIHWSVAPGWFEWWKKVMGRFVCD